MVDEVHAAHCCARHGCKYGVGYVRLGTCPVVARRVEQLYDCPFGRMADPCRGPIQVPDAVRRAATEAFWGDIGPAELTAGGADSALLRAIEAALDAWEEIRDDDNG